MLQKNMVGKSESQDSEERYRTLDYRTKAMYANYEKSNQAMLHVLLTSGKEAGATTSKYGIASVDTVSAVTAPTKRSARGSSLLTGMAVTGAYDPCSQVVG
jgi:hypothetical protein